MKKSFFIFSVLLLSSLMAWGQWDDHSLYQAFLRNDMATWNRYLHANSFLRLTQDEQLRYLSYEFGYVNTAIEEKANDTQEHIDAFEAHINVLEPALSESQLLVYRSTLAAYIALYNKVQFLTKGLESSKLAKKAYEADTLNPIALNLRGCVDMRAPKAVGGNRKRALTLFLRAKELFEQKGDTIDNWNYVSNWLCIAQSYETLKRYDDAILTCEALLRFAPDYLLVRDHYLPTLRARLEACKD